MRTVSTNLYTYDELSDKAQSTARDWRRNLEAQDPAALKEYQDSLTAAIKFIRLFRDQDTLDELYAATEALRADPDNSCSWTGWYTDDVTLDAILAAQRDGVDSHSQLCQRVEAVMAKALDDEMEYTMSTANVEDAITSNGYEFTVDGHIAP